MRLGRLLNLSTQTRIASTPCSVLSEQLVHRQLEYSSSGVLTRTQVPGLSLCSSGHQARWGLGVWHACTVSGQACQLRDGAAVTQTACFLELDERFCSQPGCRERLPCNSACSWRLYTDDVASCRCATRPPGGRATHVFPCFLGGLALSSNSTRVHGFGEGPGCLMVGMLAPKRCKHGTPFDPIALRCPREQPSEDPAISGRRGAGG